MFQRHQVIVALLIGIWTGALLVSGFSPLGAFLRTFDTYFVGAFTGEGNAEVLLFTFLLGGTIGLVQRSGGALGLANALKGFMGEDATLVLPCFMKREPLICFYDSRFHGCVFHMKFGQFIPCKIYIMSFIYWLASDIASHADTRKRGQACTVALGCLIFFDDYSSILIVGNSLRDVVGAVGVSA